MCLHWFRDYTLLPQMDWGLNPDLRACLWTHCRQSLVQLRLSLLRSLILPPGQTTRWRQCDRDYAAKWWYPSWDPSWLGLRGGGGDGRCKIVSSSVHSSSRMDLGIASGMRSGQPTSCSGDFYFGEAQTSSATGRRRPMTPNCCYLWPFNSHLWRSTDIHKKRNWTRNCCSSLSKHFSYIFTDDCDHVLSQVGDR